MITLKDNAQLGQQIKELSNGDEFTYSTIAGDFVCVKVSDSYVASENGYGQLIIFDVFDNCLSLGQSNAVNYNAIKRMAKGLRVN